MSEAPSFEIVYRMPLPAPITRSMDPAKARDTGKAFDDAYETAYVLTGMLPRELRYHSPIVTVEAGNQQIVITVRGRGKVEITKAIEATV